MVGKVLKFFDREVTHVHEAAYILAFFALLSQVLAFIRDRLFAHTFGAGEILDLYYAAFRIPDFIFVTVASIVSISILVPFLSEKFEKGLAESRAFISTIFSFFAFFMIVVSLVAFFVVPYILPYLFPGFSDGALKELLSLTRIMLLSPIILGVSNLFGSICQVKKKFFVYSISPLFYNVGIICGVIALFPLFGIKGLALGVVLGALLHLLIQVPVVSSLGLRPKFIWKPDFALIKKTVLISFPRTFTLATHHISAFALVAMASLMPVGSIAVFNFALNLQSFPLTIVGMSYSMAAFATLSMLAIQGKKQELASQIVSAATQIIFWCVPISILFLVLRAHIVRTILGSGGFDWTDTRLTAAVLGLLVFSATAQSLVLLFVRAFYAMGKTRIPLVYNALSSTLIIVFAFVAMKIFYAVPFVQYFLESFFEIEDIQGTSVITLGLGYSFGLIINAILLWYALRRELPQLKRALRRTFFQSLSASIIAGAVVYGALRAFDSVFSLSTIFGVFMHAFVSGVIGIAVGIFILYLLKSPELKVALQTLHSKLWKTKVIAPEQNLT